MTVEETGGDGSARSGVSYGTVGGVSMRWVAISNPGRVRMTNEDGALTGPGLFLLADGMGGHDRGEVASAAALEALAEVFGAEPQDAQAVMESVVDRLRSAHATIEGIDSDSGKRAGTTVTGVVLTTYEGVPHWLVVNIGDSRTYRLAGGYFEQLTVDHSQVQELVNGGFLSPEQARTDPRRNVITRALGAGMEPDADFWIVPAQPEEKLLLCSDGLNGELTDDEILAILDSDAPIDECAEQLISAALNAGGRDNVTVVVVDVTTTLAESAEPVA
ncbi:protein phosphatase 2C domain-containing protein [Tsukamurella sp. 8F]|uniref:PP2C family protein-serine/threonine phosphatase n=1 Tax=unclassified Tsukamurella TaxID=2633480 RepID=UPI0023B97515|nr:MULTISPECIES: protein phosphatase 2C domain-containing protein [unclassified Tsukamurella]MDF0531377.1 protein phosphatase 2C domain-containing protein [Tsukamurella sp. 8J]MDF0585317.1 protein phosphatase 2C domain-containing protein [Tsukamurella sp. 8F]